jgi:hypothetical protein
MGVINKTVAVATVMTAAGTYGLMKHGDKLGDALAGDPAYRMNGKAGVLKYPLDVEAKNGHYIIFNIYERLGTNFSVDNQDLNINSVDTNSQYYNANFTSEKTFDADTDFSKVPKLGDALKDVKFLKGNPKEIINKSIVLYMPEDIGVKFSAEHAASDVGLIGKLAAGLGDMMKGNTTGGQAALSGIVAATAAAEPLITFGTLGGAEGLGAAIQSKTGLAAGDVTEMTFKGIGYRDFNYSFTMTPRNQKEAEEIKKIVDTFAFHMLPEKIGRGAALAYRVPGQFTMRYMYRGRTNNYLHQQTFMALTDMEVKYGSGKFRAYRSDETGAPPVQTTISLTFKETELVDRKRYADGLYTTTANSNSHR